MATPLTTGTSPMSWPPMATWTTVFCGAPRLSRSSFDTANCNDSPGTAVVGSGVTSVVWAAKSGVIGELASR